MAIRSIREGSVNISDVAPVINDTIKALVDAGAAGTPVHYGVSEQTITLADASTLASAVALVNHMRDVMVGDTANEVRPGHVRDTLVHAVVDAVNDTAEDHAKASSGDEDSGLALASALIDAICTDYSAHRSEADVHLNDDSGHAITALAAKSTATILCDTKANHADGDTVTIDDGVNDPIVFEIEKTTASTGTILFDTVANHGLADTVTVNDGTNPAIVFELDKAGNGVAGGNIAVDISGDTTAAQVAARFKTALDVKIAALLLNLSSGISSATVSVTATLKGTGGNITLSKSSSSALAVATVAGTGVNGVDSDSDTVNVNSDTTAAHVAARLKTAIDARISSEDLALATSITSGTVRVTSTAYGVNVSVSKSGAFTVANVTATAALVLRANDAKAQINAHVAAGSGCALVRVTPL